MTRSFENKAPVRRARRATGHPNPKESRRSGFTLIEVMIVIAIFGLASLIAMPFLSNFLVGSDLNTFTAEAGDALVEARASAMSGLNTGQFGVHFETDKFVFFEGSTYNPADTDNIDHDLTGYVSITSITLTGGGNEIFFASHRGTTAQDGSVVFTDAEGNTKTVTVNAAGMIDIN